MYGLAVIEVMTMSGHLSNIDEICPGQWDSRAEGHGNLEMLEKLPETKNTSKFKKCMTIKISYKIGEKFLFIYFGIFNPICLRSLRASIWTHDSC